MLITDRNVRRPQCPMFIGNQLLGYHSTLGDWDFAAGLPPSQEREKIIDCMEINRSQEQEVDQTLVGLATLNCNPLGFLRLECL